MVPIDLQSKIPSIRLGFDVIGSAGTQKRTVENQPPGIVGKTIPVNGFEIGKISRQSQPVEDTADVISGIPDQENKTALRPEFNELIKKKDQTRFFDDPGGKQKFVFSDNGIQI
jgi:hypothetical protein